MSGAAAGSGTVSPAVRTAAAVASLQQAAADHKLAVVIGTGVSVSLAPGVPGLSWKSLVRSGFEYAVRKGRISHASSERWKPQIDSNDDLDELLLAAEYMGRKLDAPAGDLYARWLDEVFANVKPTHGDTMRAIKLLQAAKIPIITLNYDHLLEEVTGAPPITLMETRRVVAFMGREEVGILHLHGSFRTPTTCVLGSIDYAVAIASEVRDLLQRSISIFGRLLFIGCGGTFIDPNFSRLVRWLRTHLGAAAPEHHALVKNDEVARYEADPAWHSFVRPVGYGADYENLPEFLSQLFGPVVSAPSPRPRRTRSAAKPDYAGVLAAYRSYLVKDCGEMTIEGVRADMDTAQRRFDLEKLFVPSKVIAFPPDFAERDPDRGRKLAEWQKKEGDPRPFGTAFERHKRLALLALPGGGKTMLLKRIAVAYLEPARRTRSPDELPELPLLPVVIRCREWREHIHRPILSLLDHIHVITGRPEIEGLRNALLPLFHNGRAMLLVDGLDEIHDDSARATFVNHLENFVREFGDARVVVTSREAGFSLVAPRIASFCARYRIAPLQEEAIHTLCDHWHVLMSGDSTTSRDEAKVTTTKILSSPALRRLAENPLLLTMLLVVKHGAGRLPPDRVSLYARAVEVLLDTWNTRGHAPLNVGEAVPQLSYIAYEMMRAGKQTATETEMLAYLQAARDLPSIGLFAKDLPHEFLKRVELRSSLLVEAGHQVDLGRIVPFFQFRHLTFQEYLAAVAVAEGHYAHYKTGDTVLIAIRRYLCDEKWKEVIPMVAVLAKKAAEPLAAALVNEGQKLVDDLKAGKSFKGQKEWLQYGAEHRLPPAVDRLLQCLIEEAEFASETLTSALSIIGCFSRGCIATADWLALCTGPYGALLQRQAIALYMPMTWPATTQLAKTCVCIAEWRQSALPLDPSDAVQQLEAELQSKQADELVEALFICAGRDVNRFRENPVTWQRTMVVHSLLERHLFAEDHAIVLAAMEAWTEFERAIGAWTEFERASGAQAPLEERGRRNVIPSDVLDRLLFLWLESPHEPSRVAAASALAMVRQARGTWNVKLTAFQVEEVRSQINPRPGANSLPYEIATLIVAYHSGSVISKRKLVDRLKWFGRLPTSFRDIFPGLKMVMHRMNIPSHPPPHE